MIDVEEIREKFGTDWEVECDGAVWHQFWMSFCSASDHTELVELDYETIPVGNPYADIICMANVTLETTRPVVAMNHMLNQAAKHLNMSATGSIDVTFPDHRVTYRMCQEGVLISAYHGTKPTNAGCLR